ncbi:MAG: DUF1015 domain-containing protein [Bacteroidetes bacterium]|nr:DUF1015 domain-containing protein [Bacteroidota bacterium]
MAHFIPFKGYYPLPKNAGSIAIDSYDNYSENDIKEILRNDTQSYINIIHKPATTHIRDFYIQIRQRLNNFIDNEWLIPSNQDSYYIYQKTDAGKNYLGIIGLSDVRDLQKGIIKPHEQTLAKRENILTQYLKEVQLNSEPVALIYEKQENLSSFLQQYVKNHLPLLHFKDKNNHALWEVKNEIDLNFIQSALTKIDYLLVADGHHRIMSSLKNYKENKNSPYFLSMLFDDENVSIEPYAEGGKKYTFSEIKTITSQNKLLPPKSTWILPKLKTGLVIYDLKKMSGH